MGLTWWNIECNLEKRSPWNLCGVYCLLCLCSTTALKPSHQTYTRPQKLWGKFQQLPPQSEKSWGTFNLTSLVLYSPSLWTLWPATVVCWSANTGKLQWGATVVASWLFLRNIVTAASPTVLCSHCSWVTLSLYQANGQCSSWPCCCIFFLMILGCCWIIPEEHCELWLCEVVGVKGFITTHKVPTSPACLHTLVLYMYQLPHWKLTNKQHSLLPLGTLIA